jgi:predicted transposase/invertase (TIGR01784 family)
LNAVKLRGVKEDKGMKFCGCKQHSEDKGRESAAKLQAQNAERFGPALAVLMELSEDERARLLAESREKFQWDQWGREKHQYSMGREEGLEEGLTKGMERGRRETAKRLRAMGLPVDQIAAATGLDPEVIDAL